MTTQSPHEIRGRGGRLLDAVLTRPSGGGKRGLVLAMAGYSYGSDAPYLYYSALTACAAGYDVLAVDFAYPRLEGFAGLPDADQDALFDEEVRAVGAAALALGRDSIVPLGKSLGSTTVLKLLRDGAFAEKAPGAVWITPGSFSGEIYPFLASWDKPSLVAYGTADAYTSPEQRRMAAEAPLVTALEMEGADHALDIDDAEGSVGYLLEYVRQLDSFLRGLVG